MSSFVRSSKDKRRVKIVDVTHMFYKFAYGGASNLTATINVNGIPTVVNSTLPAYTIKSLHRWSDYGFNPMVVCFDSRGCGLSRKAYFATQEEKTGTAPQTPYKGSRESQDSKFYEGINLTMNLLHQGGVTVMKADGYEADDLIKAAIDKAKVVYPDLPIDVITSDADLVPLVDDQVSVFLQSRKTTYADERCNEIRGYVQITPSNYQTMIEGLSAFSKLTVPYNTVLLTKLLRGDKSDNIDGYPKFTPTKYRKLIQDLQEAGVDLGEVCRYDNPVETICYIDTGLPVDEADLATVSRDKLMLKYSDPVCLTKLIEVLTPFLEEDILKHIHFVYNGINLNGAFTGLGANRNRRPAKMKADIKPYSAIELQQAVNVLKINLPQER